MSFSLKHIMILIISCVYLWSGSGTVGAQEIRTPLSAAVLFKKNNFPNWLFSYRQFKKRWNNPAEVQSYRVDGKGVSFVVGETLVSMFETARPIGKRINKNAATGSWWWRNAEADLTQQSGFVTIRVTPLTDSMLKAHRVLTIAAAVVLNARDSYGVYFINSELLMPKRLYQTEVRNLRPKDLPMMLWMKTYFSTRRGKRGKPLLVARTVGLKNFGLMEIETENAPNDVQTFQAMLWNLASYLVQRGPIIADGHTIGIGKNDRIRVLHKKSAFGSGETVYRLEFP